jgi:O-antigen biosynthesis protein
MKPYNIFSPPYDLISGGIRVLHGLRSWLETRGQEVYMNGQGGITVYPEIVHGNPLNGDKIVRYVLQKPGLMTTKGVPGPTSYDPTDRVFVFSQLYNTLGVDEKHLMFLPILNTNLFKDYKRIRKGKCVFLRRPANNPVEGFILTQEFCRNQNQLADYLNSVEVMYVYGPVSAMWDLARLCGCRLVILPSQDRFKQTKDQVMTYELCQNFNGLSWGFDEGKLLDSNSFRELYLGLRKKMEDKIDYFIEETQK